MTYRSFSTIDETALEQVTGGRHSVAHLGLNGSPNMGLDIDSRMVEVGAGTDSGSVGNIGLADDPNGPQSQAR